MSKSDDTSRPSRFEDHDTLAHTELNAVTGGMLGLSTILTRAIGNSVSAAVEEAVSSAGYPRK